MVNLALMASFIIICTIIGAILCRDRSICMYFLGMEILQYTKAALADLCSVRKLRSLVTN